MRLHAVQHVPEEDLGSIEAWASEQGHPVTVTRAWAGEELPASDSFDWLAVLGGPMSVHDGAKHPWLAAEKRFVRSAVDAGKRVIGICLGAQILAELLGGRVAPARHPEIGWFPVTMSVPSRHSRVFGALPPAWEVFHWHGETFELPPGAVRLAGSEACENQAFLHGANVLAFQFHPEVTRPLVERMIRAGGADLVDGPWVQSPAQMLGDEPRFAKSREWMRRILDSLAAAERALPLGGP
jgi:GMP synthase (glutamine-hydrolysing)